MNLLFKYSEVKILLPSPKTEKIIYRFTERWRL